MENYARAYTEVYYAINNFEDNLKTKIPEEVLDFFRNRMDLKYTPVDSEMSEEAKSILSVVYSEYLCSSEEKLKWDELDEVFKKQESVAKYEGIKPKNEVVSENDGVERNKEITVIEKKSAISQLFSRIKTFFKTLWRK